MRSRVLIPAILVVGLGGYCPDNRSSRLQLGEAVVVVPFDTMPERGAGHALADSVRGGELEDLKFGTTCVVVSDDGTPGPKADSDGFVLSDTSKGEDAGKVGRIGRVFLRPTPRRITRS